MYFIVLFKKRKKDKLVSALYSKFQCAFQLHFSRVWELKSKRAKEVKYQQNTKKYRNNNGAAAGSEGGREMRNFKCSLSAVGVASEHNTHCSMSCRQYNSERERERER